MRLHVHRNIEYRLPSIRGRPARLTAASGTVIDLPDAVAEPFLLAGTACRITDGITQCAAIAATPDYPDTALETPVDRAMRPVRWSAQKRNKIRHAAHRSIEVRRVIRGRRMEDIQPSELR